MSSHRVTKRRLDTDIHKLIIDVKHHAVLEDAHTLFVKFRGPPGSLYQNGIWDVRLHLPDDYPFKPPIVRFVNKMYHPNVDEKTGIFSTDVIREHWTTRHHLIDMFEYFLPDLLIDPNLRNPSNKIAAAIFIHAPEEYKMIVDEYVRQYAKLKE